MGRYKTKDYKEITVGDETHTIMEWSSINQISISVIHGRDKRNASGITTYTNGQIVGSEDLPQAKKIKKKTGNYKRGPNRKDTFQGSTLMQEFSRRTL